MKKVYQNPAIRMVCIQHQQIICTSGQVSNVTSDGTGIGYGGGGSVSARSRSFSVWDDDCDE